MNGGAQGQQFGALAVVNPLRAGPGEFFGRG